jgi:hypothetical protein
MTALSTDRLQPTVAVPQAQVEAPRRETNRNPRRRSGNPKTEEIEEADDAENPRHQIDDLA